MEQMTLSDVEIQEKAARAHALGQELERRIKAVAHGIERKRLAALIDRSYSYVNEMLNTNSEQSQKPWQIVFSGALLVEAPDLFVEMVMTFVAEVCGYEVPRKKRPLTPEEELRELWEKIRAHRLEGLFK